MVHLVSNIGLNVLLELLTLVIGQAINFVDKHKHLEIVDFRILFILLVVDPESVGLGMCKL